MTPLTEPQPIKAAALARKLSLALKSLRGAEAETYLELEVIALDTETQSLRAALQEEQERHSQLQSRCYEGFPSAGDGIFDALKEADTKLAAAPTPLPWSVDLQGRLCDENGAMLDARTAADRRNAERGYLETQMAELRDERDSMTEFYSGLKTDCRANKAEADQLREERDYWHRLRDNLVDTVAQLRESLRQSSPPSETAQQP